MSNMKMIQESTIEQIVEQFENEAFDLEKTVAEFAGRQPALLSFLLSENDGALTDDERDYLLYLALIIWKSVAKATPDLPKISTEEVAEAEEANWAKLETTSAKRFRERLDVFFQDYPQEDLLAFAEDALTLEGSENGEDADMLRLTPEGREPMFVALKTVIDVLTSEE